MRKILVCIISIILPMTFFNTNISANIEVPTLRSDHAIVINLNDDLIMYEKKSNAKIYPASMTKIMTTLVAIENIKDMKDTYTFKEDVFQRLEGQNASVAGFEIDEIVTMEDLLYGVLLPSGADATLALADALFGSEEKFVEKMNEKAISLGMKSTHFVNTSGLHHDEHYSTVSDISLLLKNALKNKVFKKIFMTSQYIVSNGSDTLQSTLSKQDHLIAQDTSMIQGAKTGFTNEASLCLASYAEKNDQEYIMVSAQTNSDSSYPYHIEDAGKMYHYLYDNFERQVVVPKGETIKKIKISAGKEKTYEVKSVKDITVLLEKGKKVSFEWDGINELKAPDYSDTFLGTYKVYDNKKVLYEQDYYLAYNLEGDTSLSLGSLASYLEGNSFIMLCIGAFAFSFFMSYMRSKKK